MKNLLVGIIAIAAAVGGAWVVFSGPEDSLNAGTTPDVKPTPASPDSKSEEPETENPVPSKEGPWPKIVAESTEFNFGSMQVGTEKEHTFTIRNDGESDLILKAGSPTCKCTAFELTSTTIKPGEEGQLLVRWIGKFKDDGFSHGGPVYTNDPQQTEIRFTVQGIVDAPIELFPEGTWAVGGISGESGGNFQAEVVSRVHSEFEITEITCESPHIKWSTDKLSDDQLKTHKGLCGYAIKVEATPDMPPGLLETKLTLKMDCVEEPVSVTVRANKPGPIRLLPLPGVSFDESVAGLKLGQFPASEGRTTELLVMADQTGMEGPLEFTSIETTPSFVQVELKPFGEVSGSKGRYKLSVTVPPGISRTSRDSSSPGRIEIKTNHPSGQTLNLKFSFKAF